MANLGISDFDFLLEAALGEAEVCLRGEGFCGLAACGAVTLICGVAGGGTSIAGTAKLAFDCQLEFFARRQRNPYSRNYRNENHNHSTKD